MKTISLQKSLLGLSLVTMLVSCGDSNKQSGFELKGTLSHSNGELIYLEKYGMKGPVTVDSVTIEENGNFEFKDYQAKIGFYRLKINNQSFAMLVLDSSDKAIVTGDAKDLENTYKVEGSPETTLFLEYNAIMKKREIRIDSLNKAFMAMIEPYKMDSLKVDSITKTLEKPYNAIVEPSIQEMIEKLKQNTDRYATISGIQSLEAEKYVDVFKAVDEGLSKKFPGDRNVKMYHDMVQRMLFIAIGQEAPEINLPNPQGKDIALSSLRGKVVLIDFWASWCGPCRREMPTVVKAYAKFKNKGFEIYGVSLDQDAGRWIEAIAKDGITWTQVSDLKMWSSDVVQLYNIRGIPFTVLIDKDGKILAKDLRGPELEKKLAEILN